MIYPRLFLAKSLLSDDGVLFCTIDENEFATLSSVFKEIFPEGAYEHAYISIVHNPRGQQGKNVSYVHESGIIIYKGDGKKYLADVAKAEVDSRNLRDSGTESDRTDARNCFYPFITRDGNIVDIGNVPANDFHPEQANVLRANGDIEIWPMTDGGDEKKWRYARDSVTRILGKLEAKSGRSSTQIIFNKDAGTMRSVWQNARYDSSEYGTKLLDGLIEGGGFTYPKSLWAVYDALKLMTEDTPDAIVMDFFAGSGTTGHALTKLNSDIGGNRRYILVQLPEPLESGNSDQAEAARFCKKKKLLLNIAEITKERLRKSTKDIAKSVDTGFRVFKLDSSNLRPWEPGDDLATDLLAGADNIIQGRTDEDLLTELLLKQGLDLTEPMVTETIAGAPVHAIGGGVLVVCLAPVTAAGAEALADGIADWIITLKPVSAATIFFKDSGFENDVAKANVAAILDQRLDDRLLKVRSL